MMHLVPEGYMGPVGIVCNDPNGAALSLNLGGEIVYEIPDDRVLRLSAAAPEPGVYDISYPYVQPDGTRSRLAEGASADRLQVFAVVDESTAGEVWERSPGWWTWIAYLAGVPAERDD